MQLTSVLILSENCTLNLSNTQSVKNKFYALPLIALNKQMRNYTYLTWSNFLILNISGAFIIRNNKRIQQLTIPSIKI